MMNGLFENYLNQIKKVSALLKAEGKLITEEQKEQLEKPKRVLVFDLSVEMDNSEINTFQGFRIQFNNNLGPFKGGIRFHPDVDLAGMKTLAGLMMVKCALAELPFGGAKGGVRVDPKTLSKKELERLSRAFVRAIASNIGSDLDVPAPDSGTNPEIMGWMIDEYKKLKKNEIKNEEILATFTGKPLESGGSEGRNEATGWGGICVLKKLVGKLNLKPEELTLAVQGFGNVGYYFSQFAQEAGFKVIAITDSKGGVVKTSGLNIDELKIWKKENGSVIGFPKTETIDNRQLLELEVDILVPAALENVITEKNANQIKAKIILEMANGPVKTEAEKILKEKGVICLPDVLANAGGVIVSYFEWCQNKRGEYWPRQKILTELKLKIDQIFEKTWQVSQEKKISLRQAAWLIAIKKVLQ